MDVAIGCPCPGTPHAGDTVTLMDALDFRTAQTIRKSIQWQKSEDPEASVPEILAMLTETYLLHCIAGWTLTYEKRKPVPVSKAEIKSRLLTVLASAEIVGDAADDLYAERVILPLLARASSSSPPSPTNGSTSAMNGSGRRRPKRSSPSSTTTTPTVVIVTTTPPPGGASSSSPS